MIDRGRRSHRRDECGYLVMACVSSRPFEMSFSCTCVPCFLYTAFVRSMYVAHSFRAENRSVRTCNNCNTDCHEFSLALGYSYSTVFSAICNSYTVYHRREGCIAFIAPKPKGACA